MASASQDALTECKEMRKCACTYRAGADGCGAGAGRVVTTGRAPRDNGSTVQDDGYAVHDDESTVPNNGSTAHDDGWQRATTNRGSGHDGSDPAQTRRLHRI